MHIHVYTCRQGTVKKLVRTCVKSLRLPNIASVLRSFADHSCQQQCCLVYVGLNSDRYFSLCWTDMREQCFMVTSGNFQISLSPSPSLSCRGFGFITFSKAETVDKVLKAHESEPIYIDEKQARFPHTTHTPQLCIHAHVIHATFHACMSVHICIR